MTQPTGEYNSNGEEVQNLIRCNSVIAMLEWKNYAPIEVELLRILYAALECDYYIRGAQSVEIRSDHKPLQEIFSKPLHNLSDRSLKIRIQLLDYNLVIKFVLGKKHEMADCLSRLPVMKHWEHFYPHVEGKYEVMSGQSVMKVGATNSTDDPALLTIIECVKNDEDYNQIRKCIRKGLEKGEIKKLHPEHPAKELASIWVAVGLTEDHKEPLITVGGNRIFIPRLARKQILENLHRPHMGYMITQQLAKGRYYWRTLNEDIRKKCEGCQTCIEFSPSKVGEA